MKNMPNETCGDYNSSVDGAELSRVSTCRSYRGNMDINSGLATYCGVSCTISNESLDMFHVAMADEALLRSESLRAYSTA